MGKAGAGLAQLGISISQSGAAFSQLCVVVSQVSLAISQSSLVIGQFSVTISQFIIAFSQISIAVSHYVFIISQFGSLVIQLSVALKKLSDGISSFGKELQRFSVVMVQFSMSFRHVGVTVSQFSKAFKMFVESLRSGRIPWPKVCVVVQQLSEAVCGFGIALGEVSAILSIFTTLNAQLARLAYVYLVSQKTCLLILQYASKVRKLSIGVAQLSGAIFQLSITCKHINLMVQQWLVVQGLIIGCVQTQLNLSTTIICVFKCLVSVVNKCFYYSSFCIKLVVINASHVGTCLVHLVKSCIMKVEDYFLMGFKSAYKTSPLINGILQNKPMSRSLILTYFIDTNKFAYLTLLCPKELFSPCLRLSKSLNQETVTFPNTNTVMCFCECEIYYKSYFLLFIFKTEYIFIVSKSGYGMHINNFNDEFRNILYKRTNQDVLRWSERKVLEETQGYFNSFINSSLSQTIVHPFELVIVALNVSSITVTAMLLKCT